MAANWLQLFAVFTIGRLLSSQYYVLWFKTLRVAKIMDEL